MHHLTVLILGLGDSGLAMALWCARKGAQVRVWDSRDAPPGAVALRTWVPEATLISSPLEGESLATAMHGVGLVLKSPGLSPHDVRLQALQQVAQAHQVPIQGELDLFVQALTELKQSHGYAPKVVAITGTNGKTTTTRMTELLIRSTGQRTVSAGNIGPTLLQTLSDALDQEALTQSPPSITTTTPNPTILAPVFQHLPQVWVLELSSFQLHAVQGFEPHAAAVLNVTEDHLDWHGTMESYAADKARIFGPTTVCVINQDDPLVRAMLEPPTSLHVKPPKSRTRGGADGQVHKRSQLVKTKLPQVVSFSLQSPRQPGHFGLLTENGITWLVRALGEDDTLQPPNKHSDGAGPDIRMQRLMPADALRVRGRHNSANALAALALATAIGCPLAPMLHALRDYAGEPHRVALVATLQGVDLVDDSKGTNVGATVAAVLGLGADRAPAKLVLILGGDGKGQHFEPLAQPLQRYGRAVATLGKDAALIEAALQGVGLPVQRCEDLPQATRWALQQAHQGDTVLLSPACASLDMFDNYKHRAEVFINEIHTMAQELGEVIA